MSKRTSVFVGILIAIILIVGMQIAYTRMNADSRDTQHREDETLYRDDGGSVTTVDVQGKDITYAPLGEFTDAVVQLSGPWTVREAPHAYNEICAWAKASQPIDANSRGADLSIAYIRPSLPVAGRYDIAAWWCEPKVSNLDRNLEVRIHTKAGEVYQWTYVDQQDTPGEWQDLGTFYIEPDGEVSVSNWNGAVALDAIRFVYRDDLREVATPPIPMPAPPLPSPTPEK